MSEKTANMNLNPFPGLRPFRFDESHLFFGREGQTDEVLWKLNEHKFVSIIGPSGAGKSSFVFCGVIPMLYGGYISTKGEDWEVIVSRPGGDPIFNLGKALLQKDKDYRNDDPEERKVKLKIMDTLLKSSSGSLSEAINTLKTRRKKNFLVLIDQFEELFRFKDSTSKDSSQETFQFIELLMEAIDDPVNPVHVAITMRSEFIGNCSQYPELTRKINDSHFLIPQLTRDQRKKVIEGPVSVGGGKISQALVQRLLNDMGDQKDQLPVLQHALMRTWDYWGKARKADEPMEIKHYEAIGTMGEALSLHADEAYKELNEEQKRICEVLFKSITEKKGNFGIRRPTTVREISKLANVKESQVIEVVEKFREPGRSLLTPPVGVTLRGSSIIDISHESLMRIWKRLQTWVEEEAESVNMYMRMADAAAKYQDGLSGLWRPPDLQLALNWQVKNQPTLSWGIRYNPAYERTMSFLEYSKKEYDNEEKMKELRAKRRLRAARITVGILASATVISVAFLVYALTQKTVAETNLTIAVEQTAIAESNLDSAERNYQAFLVQFQEAEKQRRRAIASADTAELRRIEAVEQTLIAQFERKQADSAKEVAVENETLAKIAEDSARRSAEIALAAQIEEERQRKKAEQLRFLDLARTLGLQATQNIPDLQLKGLLAAQGFSFNQKFEGNPYDPSIYAGLYFAITEFKDPLTQNIPWGGNDEIKAMVAAKKANMMYAGGTTGKIVSLQFNGSQANTKTISPPRSLDNVTEVDYMAISPDEKWLVAAGKFSKLLTDPATDLEIYSLPTGNPTRISGFNENVLSVSFGQSSNFAFILDNKGKSIKKLNLSQKSPESFISSSVGIIRMDADSRNRYIAGGTELGSIILWDQASGEQLREIETNVSSEVSAIEFSQDGNLLAIGFDNGTVLLYNMTNVVLLNEYTEHVAAITDISFSHNNGSSDFMSTSSRDKLVRVWDLKQTTNAPLILSNSNFFFFSTEFSPDNKFILVGSTRGVIKKYPSSTLPIGNQLCNYLERNMTDEEWQTNVGTDIPYENTCSNLALNNSNE